MKNGFLLTLALGFSLILPIQSQAREDIPLPAPTTDSSIPEAYDATSDLGPTVPESELPSGSCELSSQIINTVQHYAVNCLNRDFESSSIAGSDLHLRCLMDQSVYASLCSGDLSDPRAVGPDEVDMAPVDVSPEVESEGARLARACLRTYNCSSRATPPPGRPTPPMTPDAPGVATLSSISPNTVQEGASGVALVVRGTNFSSSSIVLWNGRNKTTSFVSATELHAQIDAADVARAGSIPVTVLTGAVVTSTSQTFTITARSVVTTGGATLPNDDTAETTIGVPNGNGDPANPSSGGGCSLGFGSKDAMTFSLVMMSFLSGAFLMLRRHKNQR